MKNQYFADRRDFFKYDLLLELSEGLGFIRQLTFIPMLTPDDGSGDGQLKGYPPGARRQDLYCFLQECLARGVRDIRELRRFFAQRAFIYSPYRDDAYFAHAGRAEYFASIPETSLRAAVVFLDPDNGLEVASMSPRTGHKYVRWTEAVGLYSRMDDDSVLVVYQHLPREKRAPYLTRKSSELQQRLGIAGITWLSDNEIAFFVATRAPHRATDVRDLLARYSARTGLFMSAC